MRNRIFLILVSFISVLNTVGQDTTIVLPWEEEFLFIDEEELDSGGVFTFWGLYFNLGTADLLDTATMRYHHDINVELMQSNEVRLSAIAAYLIRHPTYIVEVGVHSDCRVSASSSVRWTVARAKTIVNELVERGIEKERLISTGFEDHQPYDDHGILLTCDYIKGHSQKDAAEMHQKNRRFQLRILSKDYVGTTVADKLDAHETFISYKFLFNFLTDELVDTANTDLLALAAYLIKNPACRVEVGVHTDCRSKVTSRNLSQSRANAIKERLIFLGIHENRIIAAGYHGSEPLDENGVLYTCEYIQSQPKEDQPYYYQKSRRVTFKLLN